jgi:hypothetical protein
MLYTGFLMHQSTQQFYNKQISATVLALFVLWKYLYMFRPCWVIIKQSLHEYVYVTRYWVVYRYRSRSVIYTFFQSDCVKFRLLKKCTFLLK